MNLVRPTAPVVGHVVATRLCTRGKSASFVRHVCIDVSGTPLAGQFLVGQSFGIIPPGTNENGKPHQVRLYSIACPSTGEDGQGNVISTTPKRFIDERRPQRDGDNPDDHSLILGVCSNYLCDLKVGDEVLVTGPSGKRFLLPVDHDEHDYLFLATGTGVAPFRGMSMELLEGAGGPTRSEIHFVMGAAYHSDLLYDDLFTRYVSQFDNFNYHTAISRETRPDGRKGLYVHQYLDEHIEVFRDLLASPRTLLYICGLAGMQVGVFQVLAQHDLGAGYLVVKDELADIPPGQWTAEQIKRYVRPTHRCMLEVY